MTKKFQDEVNSLKQFVESERKQREESEKTISEMLRSVFAKVKEDIELERKNRYEITCDIWSKQVFIESQLKRL